ncbi:MAG: crotonase/enoyl-CoA hydratase family protein [Pseudomonadota bacterium]
MTDRVSVERDGHVAEVVLNRPDKGNALDGAMFAALADTGRSLARDADLRAVVLRGSGGHFCTGIDLSALQGGLMDNAAFRARSQIRQGEEAGNEFQAPAQVWRDLAVPVIAALHGVSYGGGMQIALGADIRFAAPDARFSIMEMKWGLVPDMGLMATLPRLMRIDQAKDLILTGRVVEAAEAAELGLVTRVVEDPLAAAREAAQAIANRSPDAVQGAKRLVEGGWLLDPAAALRLEAEVQGDVIGLPNQIEAVMANLQKRAPSFS